ncbi:MAG: hypothetical protein ABI587_07460 [Gemmatimonadales bacterium]
MDETSGWAGLLARLTGHAILNPLVAWDLLTMLWAFRRRHWWHIPPFLPRPDSEYLAWRLHTAYGEERTLPSVSDVLRFARWRRRILSV